MCGILNASKAGSENGAGKMDSANIAGKMLITPSSICLRGVVQE